MARTFTYIPKSGESYFTVDQLNALFTSIKAIIDKKLDVRGSVMESNLQLVNGTVINLTPAESAGDPIPYGEANGTP